MDEENHPDPTLLSKCLLILDNLINDEKTTEKDIPLFFYPKETELRQQVQVIQSCLAISSLSISICNSKQVKCPAFLINFLIISISFLLLFV